MKERRRDHHRLAAAEGDLVDQGSQGEQTVGAGALGPLRRTGGAGGEDHEARLVGRRPVVCLRAAGDQALQRPLLPLTVAVGPSDDPVDRAVDPGQEVAELLVVDERLRRLAPSHLGQLRAGEHRVEVERAGAELGRRQSRLDEAAVVAAHDPDPVAVADPKLGRESVGEGIGAPVQPFEAERSAFVDDRDLVRMVDRRGGDAERRRGAPADKGRPDLHRLVGAHEADDAGFVQHFDLEGGVRHRGSQARKVRAKARHRTMKTIRSQALRPRCRRFPRRGRSSPSPRCSSP